MRRKFCAFYGKDTLQNPMKKPLKGEQDYRCVECGQPRRFSAKNFAVRLQPGGRAVNIPYPNPERGALGAI